MSHLINSKRKEVGQIINRIRLRNTDFTIFSNDCWGSEVYKYFNLPYNTPFVGLMLMAPCYIKFLSDPKFYLSKKLVFQKESRYESINELRKRINKNFPMANLNEEIEIHFLHYESEKEAFDKWARRVKRINWDNIFVKFDGSKDYATTSLVYEFDKLPFSSLQFLKDNIKSVSTAVTIPNYTTDGKAQFEISLKYIDIVSWLNGSSFQSSLKLRLFNYIFSI
ncbi:DUF1919 domain-containing protein [Hymenobacter profundi]|uniref:DUF1919 domain-containing protein n=1 Tax=Hymenobacter profundi TaxID=1982110 RepID=A0ABS6WVE2_9BACT|nr:DUF1919 domain-containing protein [Hymenobacter profundi]MBW3127585.1 DUF1919 domain-containing protein [Hymenobacter profundi]